jgi:hypothetical protein
MEGEKTRYNYPGSTNRKKTSLPSIYRNNFRKYTGKKEAKWVRGGKEVKKKEEEEEERGTWDLVAWTTTGILLPIYSNLSSPPHPCSVCYVSSLSFRFSVLFPIVFTSQPLPKPPSISIIQGWSIVTTQAV